MIDTVTYIRAESKFGRTFVLAMLDAIDSWLTSRNEIYVMLHNGARIFKLEENEE